MNASVRCQRETSICSIPEGTAQGHCRDFRLLFFACGKAQRIVIFHLGLWRKARVSLLWLVNFFGFELSGPPYCYPCASLKARGAPEYVKARFLDFRRFVEKTRRDSPPESVQWPLTRLHWKRNAAMAVDAATSENNGG